jgi:hypothetical protein
MGALPCFAFALPSLCRPLPSSLMRFALLCLQACRALPPFARTGAPAPRQGELFNFQNKIEWAGRRLL